MNDDALATAEAIRAAVRTVVRTYDDPGADIRPPAALVGAPELRLEGISSEPTSARFPVLVVVAHGAKALGELLGLVPKVAEAIRDLVEDAEVAEASPINVDVNGQELPGYLIIVDV